MKSLPFISIAWSILLVCTASAQIPRTINFQGVLTDASGNAVPDGNYSLILSIYDTFAGGTRSWNEPQSVSTVKGVFTVQLGTANPLRLLFDRPLWLAVAIGSGQDLSPRIPLTSGAYAFHAQRADSADDARTVEGISVSTVPVPNTLLPLDASGKFPAIAIPGVPAVIADGSVTTSKLADAAVTSMKLADFSVTTSKIDDQSIVAGKLSASGSIAGQFLRSQSGGASVGWGDAPGLALPYDGSISNPGPALWVHNTSAASFQHSAMAAYANAGIGIITQSNLDDGVMARSYGTGTNGVVGIADNGNGIRGGSNAPGFSGVFGYNSNVGGSGVSGNNSFRNTTGYLGGEFGAKGSRDSYDGYLGYSDGGVLGKDNTSGNYTYLGMNTRACYVIGKFYQQGGDFEAHPISTIWSTNKPATVKLDNGEKRKLFAEEAAEVYFSDYGEGRLTGGRSRVDLDPIFAQTVTIDARHPAKVFVQLEEECNGVYVTNKTSRGFDVVELRNGASNARFSYRIVCKRKHYEEERLATEEQDARFNMKMLEAVWPEVRSEKEAMDRKVFGTKEQKPTMNTVESHRIPKP